MFARTCFLIVGVRGQKLELEIIFQIEYDFDFCKQLTRGPALKAIFSLVQLILNNILEKSRL